MSVLQERLEQVEERMARALARCGRSRADVTLIAVTKMFPPETIAEAYALGLREFGENYVQEFERKKPALASLADARFHLIGHLQSNKTRVAAELFHAVQTVDSEKLARRLSEARANSGQPPFTVMIEVKLSSEEAKFGADPAELPALIEAIHSCSHLDLTGLMTMPPWDDDPEKTRPYFRRLAQLAREHGLHHLSMGMSHDFEAAIEEGATHIRVGRGLFGPRSKRQD
jgi:PLP dependent protein